MNDDLDKLEDKIKQFKSGKTDESASEKELADRQTGMRAGSEFMAYIFAGGLIGWLIGHYFGNMPLWLMLMMFVGFGLGTYRAYLAMK